ncbi:MAG: hypothetical protein M3077_13255 [Candidatus Dormibacteraeota bacterium]|nr:hypothetical protein [Candidatus Dormibacteraeota bacterium]
MAEGIQQKIDWISEAAHDRFANLEFNTYPTFHPVTITGDGRPVAREVADRLNQRYGAPPHQG